MENGIVKLESLVKRVNNHYQIQELLKETFTEDTVSLWLYDNFYKGAEFISYESSVNLDVCTALSLIPDRAHIHLQHIDGSNFVHDSSKRVMHMDGVSHVEIREEVELVYTLEGTSISVTLKGRCNSYRRTTYNILDNILYGMVEVSTGYSMSHTFSLAGVASLSTTPVFEEEYNFIVTKL